MNKRYKLKVTSGRFSYFVESTEKEETALQLKEFYETIYDEVEITDRVKGLK